VDLANYQPLNARLSQGDVVLAPIAVLGTAQDFADPSDLQTAPHPLALGDDLGVTVILPRAGEPARGPVVLRAWYTPAIVVSADCVIGKGQEVLVAPIYPSEDAAEGDRAGIRAGSFVAAMSLPGDPAITFPDGQVGPWPESYVDFNQTTAVTGILAAEDRLFMLARPQLERLHFALARFLIVRELSTRGTLAAAEGKVVEKVAVVSTTGRRHTVMLMFTDGSYLIAYQEPRQDAYVLESVTIKDGRFDRESVQALTGQRLVLRFENEDRRDWRVMAKAVGLAPQEVSAADTTHVEIICPDRPLEVDITNADRPQGPKLRLRVIQPAGGS